MYVYTIIIIIIIIVISMIITITITIFIITAIVIMITTIITTRGALGLRRWPPPRPRRCLSPRLWRPAGSSGMCVSEKGKRS